VGGGGGEEGGREEGRGGGGGERGRETVKVVALLLLFNIAGRMRWEVRTEPLKRLTLNTRTQTELTKPRAADR
jgi:hypothetical protein